VIYVLHSNVISNDILSAVLSSLHTISPLCAIPYHLNWIIPDRSCCKLISEIFGCSHYCILTSHIYLWRKVVCFVLYWWDPPNRDASDRVLDLFGKLSRRRGALAWFHGVWTCGVEVLEYWMIFSLKIKLNHSWKLRRNWNVSLVLLERSWWAGFNGIYLVRFGFKMWEILIFKLFPLLKIQINSKKPGFGEKNHLRTW
jgi:hypothetical protein